MGGFRVSLGNIAQWDPSTSEEAGGTSETSRRQNGLFGRAILNKAFRPHAGSRGSESFRVLSPATVLRLAKDGIILPIWKKEIQDRSKATVIQKVLVMFQMAWVVIQCSARRAQGLPVTLLEIHTIVHIACAICMYLFWMKVRTNLVSS